jgi:hypothetical protein
MLRSISQNPFIRPLKFWVGLPVAFCLVAKAATAQAEQSNHIRWIAMGWFVTWLLLDASLDESLQKRKGGKTTALVLKGVGVPILAALTNVLLIHTVVTGTSSLWQLLLRILAGLAIALEIWLVFVWVAGRRGSDKGRRLSPSLLWLAYLLILGLPRLDVVQVVVQLGLDMPKKLAEFKKASDQYNREHPEIPAKERETNASTSSK